MKCEDHNEGNFSFKLTSKIMIVWNKSVNLSGLFIDGVPMVVTTGCSHETNNLLLATFLKNLKEN